MAAAAAINDTGIGMNLYEAAIRREQLARELIASDESERAQAAKKQASNAKKTGRAAAARPSGVQQKSKEASAQQEQEEEEAAADEEGSSPPGAGAPGGSSSSLSLPSAPAASLALSPRPRILTPPMGAAIMKAAAAAAAVTAARAPSRTPRAASRDDKLCMADAEERLCVVCMERPKSTVLLPCTHMKLCAQCCDAVCSSSNEVRACLMGCLRVAGVVHWFTEDLVPSLCCSAHTAASPSGASSTPRSEPLTPRRHAAAAAVAAKRAGRGGNNGGSGGDLYKTTSTWSGASPAVAAAGRGSTLVGAVGVAAGSQGRTTVLATSQSRWC